MGPTLILDKSALQSLSKIESFYLHRYFIVNIPPVLIMEILADLKKDDTRATPPKLVSEFAGKLLLGDGCVNGHYQELIRQSLVGNEPKMDGQPVLQGKTVRTSDGEHVILMEETAEEKAIQRWKDGRFEDSEEILAEGWRSITRTMDIEAIQRALRKDFHNIPEIGSPSALLSAVDNLLGDISAQVAVLSWMLVEYGIESNIASKAAQRLQLCGYKSLGELAPYAYYCMRVSVLYYLGLFYRCPFVGTRKTNRVDLEYLFYLPFCNAFVSNDNFHKSVVEPFLRSDQLFVHGEDLKRGLAAVADQWSKLTEAQRKDSWPPDQSGPIILALWGQFCRPRQPEGKNHIPSMTEDEQRELLGRLRPLIEKAQSGTEQIASVQDDDVQFMIRRRSYRLEDPCMCGSGLTAGECCLKDLGRGR
ncbi:MAG: hypothetical protein IT365_09030 [Candidatus Hydrogenedentes bacterium]|nr:hypothetical protein [Candidatus Hydrogenedentota bacterium]